jgi:hypothetical protein
MALAGHVKAGRVTQQMAFERCHDAEELQRLIGSSGGLSAYAGDSMSSSDYGLGMGSSSGGMSMGSSMGGM